MGLLSLDYRSSRVRGEISRSRTLLPVRTIRCSFLDTHYCLFWLSLTLTGKKEEGSDVSVRNMAQILGVLAGVGILGAALATPSRPPAPEEQEGLLECFQVAQPVLGPEGLTPSWGRETPVGDGQGECDVLLMEHSFGASYGQPFVGMS